MDKSRIELINKINSLIGECDKHWTPEIVNTLKGMVLMLERNNVTGLRKLLRDVLSLLDEYKESN